MPGTAPTRSGFGRAALWTPLAVAAILAILPATIHASFEQRLTVDAGALELVDPIGEVRLEGTDASAYEIVVRVDGRDARQDWVTVEQQPGHPARVLVRFPIDKEQTYVYPHLGDNSSCDISVSSLTGGDRSWLDWILRGGERQLKVRSRGSGLELWADVTIRVPRGKQTIARVGVGNVHAEGITGDVTLDTQCGPVSAVQITGALVADTGSGAVQASGIRGRLSADTGSGAVDLADCSGPEIVVDTGSGAVQAGRVTCESLGIDTGSGCVKLTGVETRSLSVDTGSGSVIGSGLGTDTFNIDTGSGAVELGLTRLGPGGSRIDTGSGAIELTLPGRAEAEVHAESGSGSITYDSADDQFSAEDEVSFRIGKGGNTQIALETGSGGIQIRQ
jgi:hypothetical protein